MTKQVGRHRARPFRMEDAEELESMLAASGITSLGMASDGVTGDLINAVLSLAASPQSKERFGRFVASVWDHPLQKEIDDALDEEDYDEAATLQAKKRAQYRRAPATARNEILKNLSEQQAFKDFLSSYLSLLPSGMEARVRSGVTDALQNMNSALTLSKETTDSPKEKPSG